MVSLHIFFIVFGFCFLLSHLQFLTLVPRLNLPYGCSTHVLIGFCVGIGTEPVGFTIVGFLVGDFNGDMAGKEVGEFVGSGTGGDVVP